MRHDADLETRIHALLADETYDGHPLQDALCELFRQYGDHLTQIERLTAISDGYQTVMRERNTTLVERQHKQMRHLKKIIRISDHYQKMLRELNDSLKITSAQDPLTGLANRRQMLDRLAAETARAQRHDVPFCLALADIDFFKGINDAFGHDAGDRVLIHVAKILSDGLRPYDTCARWGGEEFLILFPRTVLKDAQDISQRLRQTLAAFAFHDESGAQIPTLSIGLAQHEIGKTFEATIKKSDGALYEAKRAGRDQIAPLP